MKNWLRTVFYEVLSGINLFVPKKNKILIYADNERDNSEAVFRYLQRYRGYQITYAVRKGTLARYPQGSGRYIERSWQIAYEMMSSKVVVDSLLHQIKMRPTKGQLFLQLWHGSPLKSLSHGEKRIDMSRYYSKIVYAADLFKPHMMQAFQAPEQKMLLSGNPRNDLLFETECARSAFPHDGKRVIWMPTFRRGLGEVSSAKDIPIIDDENIMRIDALLRTCNIKLYIKFHPLQQNAKDIIQKSDTGNIEVITDDMLREKDIPLYSFVGSMDALLTDYSSVYFDFLLLNRPIGFVIDDMDEYGEKRGFAFEDPLSYMPGKKIMTLEELEMFFRDLSCGRDDYQQERERVCALTNAYRDNSNRERIAELIDRAMKEL